MTIKQIDKSDISQVVRVHKVAFEDFFLTQLGDKFLHLYYTTVLTSCKGILLGYYKDDILCGFAVATSYSKGYNLSLVKQNLLAYIKEAVCIFIKSPKSLFRLYKNMQKTVSAINDNGEYAELMSIGVDSRYKRMGIGKSLLQSMETHIKLMGAKKLSLTTDYDNNSAAVEFYKSLGFEVMYDFTTYPNRRMYRFIKDL